MTGATDHSAKPVSRTDASRTPSRRARISAALLIGLAYGAWTVASLAIKRHIVQDIWAGDFTYPWLAARALFQHVSPYQAVYDAKPPFGEHFLYPLPAALIATPVAWLPMHVAAGVAVGLVTALLAFAVSRNAKWPLLMFLSAAAVRITDSVQIWAPLFTAAAILTPALGVICAKPHVGLPMIAYQTRVRPVLVGGVVGLAIVGLSFVVYPAWLSEWWTVLHVSPSVAQFRPPILHPLGVVLILAASRWRRPEARLLLASALLPQSAYFYDQVPLLLVPGSRREMLVYCTVSQCAAAVAPISTDIRPWFMIGGLYLPALIMVMRRPNAAPEP